MVNEEMINIDDINYAIYKIGEWKNDYEINQIGLSSEIPVTKNTLRHVKLSMVEIRAARFELSGEMVNGFVAIASQLNPKAKAMELNDLIALEEKEYQNILEEEKLMIETHFVNIERILKEHEKLEKDKLFALMNNYNTLNIQYEQLCNDLIEFIKIFREENQEIRLYKTEELINLLESKINQLD